MPARTDFSPPYCSSDAAFKQVVQMGERRQNSELLPVIPAHAGIHRSATPFAIVDSRFRGSDETTAD